MANEIRLRLTGTLAPNNTVTARTLAHTLVHLQRAVDKVVLHEEMGSLKKYSSLPNGLYAKADFIVLPFEPGSIRIPLVSAAGKNICRRLRGMLEAPYRIASQEDQGAFQTLREQTPAAINRAVHNDTQKYTQQYLIDHPELVEREFVQASVLADIDSLLSPLRSSRANEDDSITLTFKDNLRTRDYEFDKQTSKAFSKIVKQSKLGPEIIYEGTLHGLERSNSPSFPFAGKFVSHTTDQESKLLVPSEESAFALNDLNLRREPFRFWGAPVMRYGTFDPMRGDIVFLMFLND